MSGNRLVLDTNIILGYLAGKSDTTAYLKGQLQGDLYASVITRMEDRKSTRLNSSHYS